ncbi:hypothetical protein M9Y10_025979 [Tritrichomonas musculus]|uniref:DUF3447 domain-containing protein n=1 Tax=Tritrichomonas musculus TaxID=1915356 RepID=A0ABR2H887_9EUKA
MEAKYYVQEKKKLQSIIIFYFEDDCKGQENLVELCNIIETQDFLKNHEEYEIFLRLLNKISKNHQRNPDFFNKIEQIIDYLKPSIIEIFSNTEIFNIFKKNKLILLLLFSKKIMTIDSNIFHYFSQSIENIHYFYPEIKPFLKQDAIDFIEKKFSQIDENIFVNFDKKRQIGENDSYICELIRNDSVKEFISYVNRTNLPLSSSIQSSFFETNPFLIKKDSISLIEYAAFFGAIQIFQYLHINKAKLKPDLWLYAIHGKNGEIIHLLEENKIKPSQFNVCFAEAIKCHHNEIASYIQSTYFNENEKANCEDIYRYFNFEFIQDELNGSFDFSYLCKYNYITLVKLLLNTKGEQILNNNLQIQIF